MRRMFSKKQLEELIKENSGKILKVNNVKQLNDEQCNNLEVGDIVAKKTGNQYHLYLVTYKEEKQGLCLSYFDASVVETQSYDYTAGHWVYNSEDKTELGNFDPSTLYGKFVRIMKAPSSTTLTDEQISQIKEGVFIKGTFLGFDNPVLYPCVESTTSIRGFIISQRTLRGFEIATFNIIKSSKVISVIHTYLSFNNDSPYIITFNGKQLPNYPGSNYVGQFICRKGTLEYYIPVAQNGITSGDVIALNSDLGKALLDHLEVEINGYRARYEYTDGNYVIYSSKSEVASGLKLQINMISYNTTNGELSFNQMTFTPDA